jgi:putative ABC transport system permease protein
MKSVQDIRPILSAMRRNKIGASLITLQIAITLAVVVNALFIINGRIEKISKPMGIDTNNIFSIQTTALSEGINTKNFIQEDLKKIRSIDGVREATPVLRYLQSGASRAETYRATPQGNHDVEILANINYSDEHGLSALGVDLLEGRFFRRDEIEFISIDYNGTPSKVIVTETLGRKFFPEGNIAGRTIYYDTEGISIEVIGVISDVATGWVARDLQQLADTEYNFMLHPYVMYNNAVNYLIRAQDGQLSSIIPQVEETLLNSDPNRLLRLVKKQTDVVKNSFAKDYATVIVLTTVMILMVLITGLGIVGLASFSVKQRTRQIGTRRALGARKKDILRYFVVENVLLTTMGVLLGVVLTYILNYTLSVEFGGERLAPEYLPGGIIILYVLGLIAVFGPAQRAASIPPAVATRTV